MRPTPTIGIESSGMSGSFEWRVKVSLIGPAVSVMRITLALKVSPGMTLVGSSGVVVKLGSNDTSESTISVSVPVLMTSNESILGSFKSTSPKSRSVVDEEIVGLTPFPRRGRIGLSRKLRLKESSRVSR